MTPYFLDIKPNGKRRIYEMYYSGNDGNYLIIRTWNILKLKRMHIALRSFRRNLVII